VSCSAGYGDVVRWSPRLIAGLGLVIFVACVFGWLAFSITSSAPPERVHSNPVCVGIVEYDAGFDPWTGLPHGRFYTCPPAPGADPTMYFQVAVPDELIGRRAIPLPIGFALGAILAGGIWVLSERPSRPPAPVADDIATR
jgi:hypothetical protein